MPGSPPTSRVVAILEALAGSEGGVASSALARSLDLSTSTVSLILAALADAKYVERLPDRSYLLGTGLMRLLSPLERRFPILGVANEELAQLSAQFGCGASISRIGLDGQEVILTTGATRQLGITPGVRVPIDPPTGTIAMAWRSPQVIDDWLSNVPAAIRESTRTGLSQVKTLGYAVYGIRPDAGSTIDRLRDLLNSIQIEHDAEQLQEQLDQLAALVGSRIYTTTELEAGAPKDVSHIIAPIFADQQPRYLLSMHLMKQSVPAKELSSHVITLLKSARTLTATLSAKRADNQEADQPEVSNDLFA